MSPTWQEAQTPKTLDPTRADLLAKVTANGGTVAGWPDTAPQRAMVEGNATAIVYESGLRAQIAATASPATCAAAGSSWVDAAVGWYDLDNGAGGKGRILATKAVWDVPLIVAAASAPITIDNNSKILVQAQDGTIFESAQSTPIVLNAASSYKGTIRFAARKTGATGNVTAGQIVKVISGPAGLAIDGTGTQVRVLGARDDETNAQYIARGLGRWGTLGAGWSSTSFDYLIPKFAPNVTGWRVRTDNPNGPGTIEVVLRNAGGASSPTENTAVLAGLSAPGVMTLGTGGISVISASPKTITVAGTLYGDGTNATLLANATAALDALGRALKIGGDVDGFVRLALLIEVLMGGASSTYGLPGFTGATNLVLSSPAADTTIHLSEVVGFSYAGLVLG